MQAWEGLQEHFSALCCGGVLEQPVDVAVLLMTADAERWGPRLVEAELSGFLSGARTSLGQLVIASWDERHRELLLDQAFAPAYVRLPVTADALAQVVREQARAPGLEDEAGAWAASKQVQAALRSLNARAAEIPPLSSEDRGRPWLEALSAWIDGGSLAEFESAVSRFRSEEPRLDWWLGRLRYAVEDLGVWAETRSLDEPYQMIARRAIRRLRALLRWLTGIGEADGGT